MKKLFVVLVLLAAFVPSQAQSTYDFSAVSSSGDTLYYYLDDGIAVVTCPGDIDEDDYWPEGITQPQGALVIDGTVSYNDTTYTVATIGEYAFYGCSSITSVTLPESLNTIQGWAFYKCSSLTSVSIPASVTDFGNYIFSGAALPEPIYKDSVFVYMPVTATGVYTIPDQITYICGGAFYRCALLTHVVLPNSVTEIGSGAFLECDGLTQPVYNNTLFARLPSTYSGSYTIPDGILTVCASSFTYTTGLTELIMPNSVTSLGGGALGYCTHLTSVTLSDALTEIPSFAFMRCTALPTITLPAGIDHIGPGAFNNCTAMDSIVVKSNTPPSFGMSAFRNIPDSCLIIVPCGTLGAYTETWGTYFTRIVEDCGLGIDDIATDDFNVYVQDGRIVVEGADDETLRVFDVAGHQIANQALPTGICLVRIGDRITLKVSVVR